MIPDNQEEQRLLIAEYVLGLHRGEQAVEIERWLAEDEQAARQAAHWREHWVGAAELLEPARLPPGLWRLSNLKALLAHGKHLLPGAHQAHLELA